MATYEVDVTLTVEADSEIEAADKAWELVNGLNVEDAQVNTVGEI